MPFCTIFPKLTNSKIVDPDVELLPINCINDVLATDVPTQTVQKIFSNDLLFTIIEKFKPSLTAIEHQISKKLTSFVMKSHG